MRIAGSGLLGGANLIGGRKWTVYAEVSARSIDEQDVVEVLNDCLKAVNLVATYSTSCETGSSAP
jgi:hypothetical protein